MFDQYHKAMLFELMPKKSQKSFNCYMLVKAKHVDRMIYQANKIFQHSKAHQMNELAL